ENLIKLNADKARINIRIPVIGGVNASAAFMGEVVDFLKNNSINVAQVNLLPYHNIAMNKYKNLDRGYEEELMQVPSAEEMESFKKVFTENSFNNTKIGG
ncbi:MAG: glycyl-radical enzyme activating protein, partial [Oscillospiraceae bacterium]